MTRLVSARVGALSGYTPGEQPRQGKLLKLNTNENPYPPSPAVVEALGQAAAAGMNLYPPPMADELRVQAAEHYAVEPSQVLAGNGSDDLLAICVRACVEEGSTVAATRPSYTLYRTLAEMAGARLCEVDCDPSEPLPRALLEAQARLTFLSTPNSPLGTAVRLDEIARLSKASEGLVVADEAYVDFGSPSALEILHAHPNLLVLRSFSKSYSLAGLRLGLAFGSAELIAGLAKVKDSYNVSRLAIAAGIAALKDHAWMETNVERIRATRERVLGELGRAGYRVRASAANFFWLDCGAEGGRAVYERLRAEGVLTRFFDEPSLRGGVRVSVGTDEAMDRFLAVLLGRR